MVDLPHYLHAPPGSALPDIGHLSPFRAVVIIESPVMADWQWRVSAWLVQSGCLYMMAWGHDCSSWDDSVDIANTAALDYGGIPDDRFVYTTWHSDETLAEVFDFCARHAVHPVVNLSATILVHVACRADEAGVLQSYAEACGSPLHDSPRCGERDDE